jgi:hypothetical protein
LMNATPLPAMIGLLARCFAGIEPSMFARCPLVVQNIQFQLAWLPLCGSLLGEQKESPDPACQHAPASPARHATGEAQWEAPRLCAVNKSVSSPDLPGRMPGRTPDFHWHHAHIIGRRGRLRQTNHCGGQSGAPWTRLSCLAILLPTTQQSH